MKNHKYIKYKLLGVYHLKSPFDNHKMLLCRYIPHALSKKIVAHKST